MFSNVIDVDILTRWVETSIFLSTLLLTIAPSIVSCFTLHSMQNITVNPIKKCKTPLILLIFMIAVDLGNTLPVYRLSSNGNRKSLSLYLAFTSESKSSKNPERYLWYITKNSNDYILDKSVILNIIYKHFNFGLIAHYRTMKSKLCFNLYLK